MLKGKLFIAGPFDDDIVRHISDGFSVMLGREIAFSVKRDGSLIGGFMAIIDGRLYDSSVRSKIEQVERQLHSDPSRINQPY